MADRLTENEKARRVEIRDKFLHKIRRVNLLQKRVPVQPKAVKKVLQHFGAPATAITASTIQKCFSGKMERIPTTELTMIMQKSLSKSGPGNTSMFLMAEQYNKTTSRISGHKKSSELSISSPADTPPSSTGSKSTTEAVITAPKAVHCRLTGGPSHALVTHIASLLARANPEEMTGSHTEQIIGEIKANETAANIMGISASGSQASEVHKKVQRMIEISSLRVERHVMIPALAKCSHNLKCHLSVLLLLRSESN